MEKIKEKSNLWDKITKISLYLCIAAIMTFSYTTNTVIIANVSLALFCGIGLVNIIINKKIYLGKIYMYYILMILWFLMTAVWAIDNSLVFSKVITISQIMFFAIILYNNFYTKDRFKYIVKAIFIGGMLMCIYSIAFYGIGNIIESMIDGIRLGAEISQENVYGMFAAIACILGVYYFIYFKNKIYMVAIVISFLIALSSGSRKALLIIVAGTLLIIIFKFGLKKIYKTVIAILILGVSFIYLMQFPMFDMINSRMEQFFEIFDDSAQVDNSTDVRNDMIEQGVEFSEDRIIQGYGLDNYKILYGRSTGMYVYAHNNYIEILVGTGIVGVVIYYWIYLYIFIKLLKYKIDEKSVIIFILLAIILAMDISVVSYYDKMSSVYVVIGLLTVNYIAKKIEEKEGNDEKI